jgi:hypothetical protein
VRVRFLRRATACQSFWGHVSVYPAPNAGYGGSFRYSPCPRELELQINYDAPIVIVPIGGP